MEDNEMKLKWEQDFHTQGTQPRGDKTQWWKASWFVLFFHVFGFDGQWRYRIYGNNQLTSKPMFETKEAAFTAVETRLRNVCSELETAK